MTDEARNLEATLDDIDSWGADHAAAAVVSADGRMALHGDPAHPFEWASVTKLVTAVAVLIAVERDVLSLDHAAGPSGSTVRHLLAHTSGLAFEGETPLAQPGRRRIYSNGGFDVLGEIVSERTGRPFERVVEDWILKPLGMAATSLVGRPAAPALAVFAHKKFQYLTVF